MLWHVRLSSDAKCRRDQQDDQFHQHYSMPASGGLLYELARQFGATLLPQVASASPVGRRLHRAACAIDEAIGGRVAGVVRKSGHRLTAYAYRALQSTPAHYTTQSGAAAHVPAIGPHRHRKASATPALKVARHVSRGTAQRLNATTKQTRCTTLRVLCERCVLAARMTWLGGRPSRKQRLRGRAGRGCMPRGRRGWRERREWLRPGGRR